MEEKKLWEMLIPEKYLKSKQFNLWQQLIHEISGGITILSTAKGTWISPNGELLNDAMIPVRFIATETEAQTIAELSLVYFEQQAIMYYKISDQPLIIYKNNSNTQSKK